MKNAFYVLISLILAFLIIRWAYQTTKPDYWMGIFYPLEGRAIYSTKFQTKEECAIWARDLTRQRPQDKDQESGHKWECNRNCELSEDYEHLLKNSPDFVADLDPMYTCEDGGFDDADWSR